jgi:hypothetical protein
MPATVKPATKPRPSSVSPISRPSESRRITLTAPIARAPGLRSSQSEAIGPLCGTVMMAPSKLFNWRRASAKWGSASGDTWKGTMTASRPRWRAMRLMPGGAFTWTIGSARMPSTRVLPVISRVSVMSVRLCRSWSLLEAPVLNILRRPGGPSRRTQSGRALPRTYPARCRASFETAFCESLLRMLGNGTVRLPVGRLIAGKGRAP